MPNTLGLYNPLFYAQEALIQLEKNLGMAMRIHRGYERERIAFGKGDTINIRRPGRFVAQAAPASAAQGIEPDTVVITLNQWREVRFELSDKEFAYTQNRIIDEHIAPAARALATDIDNYLNALYIDVPWSVAATSTAVPGDIVAVRKVQSIAKVPMDGDLHLMIGPTLEADFLSNSAFSQQQGAGDTGVGTQLSGFLGRKFGYEIFMNQNITSHTSGSLNTTAILVNNGAGYAKGATAMNVDAGTLTGTIKKGDAFSISGNTQRYVVTGDKTASANAIAALAFFPPLVEAVIDDQAITVQTPQASAVTHQSIAFHKNAFALAIVPLQESLARQMGVLVASIRDDRTGLGLRSRMYYDGNNSKVIVALDVLFGVKTLDPNLAVRLTSANA
jgi:hypothetical protein